MKRLLCLWLPNWPIQRLRSQLIAESVQPETTGGQKGVGPLLCEAPGGPQRQKGSDPFLHTPLMLWRSDPRKGRLVVACCRQASRMGVRLGMPIAEASELAVVAEASSKQASIPSGKTFLPPLSQLHDPVLDNQAIEQLACELQKQISPLVAIESLDQQPWAGQPLHQPQALLCDITGIAHLFGGEAELLAAAERRLGELGLTARMAIADSVGAAWALAHYAEADHVRIDAANDSIAEQLGCLPVEALRIPPATVSTLARLGVTHIDALLDLPRAGLASRLGKHLIRRIGQLLGEIDEPIDVHHAPAEDRQSLDLEYPTDDLAILTDSLAGLTEKLRAGLATRQRGALRLECCLVLADHPPLTFEIGFFAPTLDATHMFQLMVGCIENRKLPSLVQRITVSITLSGALRSSQHSLFGDMSDQTSDLTRGSSLSRMVNALSGRLGRDAVLGVSPSTNPLPEQAYELYPLTGRPGEGLQDHRTQVGSPKGSSSSSNSSELNLNEHEFVQPSRHDALRRPLNLLDHPVPLSPIDETVSNQLPSGFRLGGKVHRVVRHWGPERIETGWWCGPSIRRDYFRIETNQGDWWWVYRNLAAENSQATRRQQWMLQGRFA